ncbi:MAG: molybdopterin molybdenumtransferase MoeA [Sphingomonadaceae bacterium PASS1]|nr:MAG: molybdopterin molybdenumtransferase MoeA [Sphingomonadaceae bacterium PASS1]
MISVAEAQARLLALASPLPSVELELTKAARHYLHGALRATRTQPAADLSAMDGYALSSAAFPGPWHVIGESAAGRPFAGVLEHNQAVRIFTGAHVPAGADATLIQEDASRDGDTLMATAKDALAPGMHIRTAGGDFSSGDTVLATGTMLEAGPCALAAMAGHGSVQVGRWPHVTIVATGDELLPAGIQCSSAQIPSSNSTMLHAMLSNLPCEITDAGIIPDRLNELETRLSALASTTDIIVTTGGASVGDHDLVQAALRNVGADMDFWKVAMRPGKPVMAGKVGNTIVLGLPGNPTSAFVTAFLFLLPLIRYMAGSLSPLPEIFEAKTTNALAMGGSRAEYVRGKVEDGAITPFNTRDSGLVSPLSQSNALIIRDVYAPATATDAVVQYHRLF